MVFFTFVICLLGCGKDGADPNALHLRLKNDITTLDPAFIVDVQGGKVAAKIFNGLVRYDNGMSLTGDLAESWKISRDGRTYTFKIRPGVRFSNGEALTPEDIVFSFERILSSETLSPRKWTFDKVKNIKTTGGNKVILTLKEPFAPFLSLLTLPSAYIVRKKAVLETGSDFGREPVGTGPFQLQEWKPSTELVLTENPYYFEGAPEIKKISYRIIPEDFVAVGEFERGRLDVLEIPRADFKHYMNNPKWSQYIVNQTGLNTYYLGFNCSRPPFNSKRIRQAVNYAIQKEVLARKVMESRCQIATGPVPPVLNNAETPQETGYSYNINKAKELLKQSGISLPLRARLYLNQDKEVFSIATFIKEDLSQIGIELDLIPRDWSAFKEAVNKGDADCFFLSWWADYPDPENFLFPTFHSGNFGGGGNRTFFKQAQVDQWIEEAQKTADGEKRNTLYSQIQNKIIEEAPWVFLWHKKDFFIHQPRVENFRLYPVYTMEKGTGIVLKNPD